MKYLVIEDKKLDVRKVKRIVRNYYPKVPYPHFKNRQPQFYFSKSELTKENVKKIANDLGMDIIKMSDVRAVLRY